MKDKQKAALFMDIFWGRRDVYGRQKISEDGKRNFFPVCKNFWAEGCHIRLKDGKHCATCKIKEHEPVTEKSVLKHIKGEEQQIQYVLLEDGTVRFAAVDFDYKEGKEAKGYTFEDVQKIAAVLKEWGVHYRIARSTGRGFHLYLFLADAYPANKIRAILMEAYEAAGFKEEMRQGVRPLPELFPKQTVGGIGGIGNGIKPPMIQPNFEKERNCLVDDNNVMIPADLQWEYLAKSPRNDVAHLDALIEKYKMPVIENQSSGGSYRGVENFNGMNRGQWRQPKTGSMDKVAAACPAIRALMKKMEKGHVPGHDEGFALYHMSMSTADGLEWFRKNARGWGQNEADMRQLEHSMEKNYSPWTCRTMQDKGVCAAGTKCMEKRPPLISVEGELVPADVPEDQWPEPSPIRYAFGKGEDFLFKLQKEAEELKDETDPTIIMQVVRDLAKRAQVFDKQQQSALMEHLFRLKLAKKAELKPIFNEASSESEDKAKARMAQNDNVVTINGEVYERFEDGRIGYAVIRTGGRGNDVVADPISDFELRMKEERVYFDEKTVARRIYSGNFINASRNIEFEIDSDAWSDNNKFAMFFERLAGMSFTAEKMNFEKIRLAARGFALRDPEFKSSTWYITQGWYGSTYITPSVLVDQDGIRPNTEKRVDLEGKECASQLDFKILSDPEFRDVLFHIKKDVFKTWPRRSLFVSLAHTLQAGFHNYLGFSATKPTVWIEGSTGGGKSAMTMMCQYFWGDFSVKGVQNWGVSYTSAIDYAHSFKDSCLVIDDYKGTENQPKTAKAVLQSIYDPNSGGRARRDGTQRESKPSRCLLLCSGEDTPASQASVIARMILIRYPQWNKVKTAETHAKYEEMRQYYCGITPRFIHFVLNHDRKALHQRVNELVTRLAEPVQNTDNGLRVAKNLALNVLSWQLFVDFMLQAGVVDHREAGELKMEHMAYIEDTRMEILNRCEDEKTGNLFVSIVIEKLQNGDFTIKNLDGFDNNDRGLCIGFVKASDKVVETAYMYQRTLVNEINRIGKDQGLHSTVRGYGDQLIESGVIVEHEKGRHTVQVKEDGKKGNFWAIRLDRLGIFRDSIPKVVGGTEAMNLEHAPVDADGLI